MSGIVVIKWGGGLITKKDQMCQVEPDVLDGLAKVAAKSTKRLVIVHGAGSFGHLKAKQHRLAEGILDGVDQLDAVEQVREDMITLNSHVMEALERNGVTATAYHPHKWASETGPDFLGDLPLGPGVTVVHGDVVDCEDQGFGILSGDDLVVRYAIEIPRVERLVFAINGVDGLLRVPPSRATKDDLIKEWSPGVDFEGEHEAAIDVTGGIGLKAARGAIVAQRGVAVCMVRGEDMERVLDAIEGRNVIGTKILPEKF